VFAALVAGERSTGRARHVRERCGVRRPLRGNGYSGARRGNPAGALVGAARRLDLRGRIDMRIERQWRWRQARRAGPDSQAEEERGQHPPKHGTILTAGRRRGQCPSTAVWSRDLDRGITGRRRVRAESRGSSSIWRSGTRVTESRQRARSHRTVWRRRIVRHADAPYRVHDHPCADQAPGTTIAAAVHRSRTLFACCHGPLPVQPFGRSVQPSDALYTVQQRCAPFRERCTPFRNALRFLEQTDRRTGFQCQMS
jgi:hypothetical protein